MSTLAGPAAYRARGRTPRSARTRERILAAVRALLEEGRFHEAPVEDVAERAGVSRATLYQHFGSRLELVDAICDTFAVNPALTELRTAVVLDDPADALAETIRLAVRFWASEDPVLAQLYGVAAIDPAAQALVERQRGDRRGEMTRLARRLRPRLREGVGERGALERLMLLTSYGSYRELAAEGLAERQIARSLQQAAHSLLLA